MNAPTAPVADVSIRIGDATVSIPGELAVMAYLRQMLDEHRPQPFPFDAVQPPRVGAPWEGGIYAGLTVHENEPMALVLLPGEKEDIGWEKAKAWAAEQGGELPSRVDQLILFKNLKSEFKDAWYWSGEQYAGGSGYAWGQGFGDGGQGGWRKVNGFRARAVRRLPIQ